MKIGSKFKNSKINTVEITTDNLSDRGGLLFFLRYIDKIGFLQTVEDKFGYLRKSSKGESISELVRQFLAFSFDGTSHSISRFDELKNDPGYAGTTERTTDGLASTATMKRFFKKFQGNTYSSLRSIINDIFIWRLKQEKPEVIILHLDTMVLDNDDAKMREGVKPTYKNKCGFQPLQINWGPYIIDMHFRSGEKHSNHGDDAKKAVARIVKLIRKRYDRSIPIIINADSGFLAEENLKYFEDELKIQFIVMGKLYNSVYSPIIENDLKECGRVERKDASWICYDYMSKLDSWDKQRRTILTSMVANDDQYVLQGIRDSVMYTNFGTDDQLDLELKNRNHSHLLTTTGIVRLAHQNGEEELNHRSIKNFIGFEHLPFKNFGMNGAYYSLMVIGHFFMEAFRHDVLADIIPARCYPEKIRRILIDIAVKIVKGSRKIVMKVTSSVWDRLEIDKIWKRCNNQPALSY